MKLLVLAGATAVCRRCTAWAVMAIVYTGCVVGSDPPDPNPIDTEMLARIPPYKTYAKMGPPFPSQVGGSAVSIYVSAGEDEYKKIHPATSGSHAQLPVGAVIVREILDEGDQVAKLTIMGKGPVGYDPTLGDWWFAVTDADGRPLEESGREQAGKLVACHSCHTPRADDDFLFGAP